MPVKLLFFLLLLSVGLGSCQTESPVEKEKPNILFCISDDQSFGHTGFGGSTWIKTPAFDRIASEGIYFTNCYAGSPGCAPSRSSIVTGRYHWQNEQAGQHAAGWLDKYKPFVDVLTENDYHTGVTGKGVGPFEYGDTPLRTMNAAGKLYNEIKYSNEGVEDDRYAKGIDNVNYFENFKAFLGERKEDQPFFFWYGCKEPHRSFEKDSWIRRNKKLEDVIVPDFLPDVEEIRGDLLDYAVEIEWFDLHLARMIQHLEEIGELENTVIIVTSDNGMAFPRAKANGYEYGIHVPMAIRFPKGFPSGRKIHEVISFVDLAPTILELAQVEPEGMQPMSGQSLLPLLKSSHEDEVYSSRGYAMIGRERHSCSRYLNWGYPQRMLRKGDFLLTWNIKPDRWPAGAPQRLKEEGGTETWPMYGIDEEGVHHSEWAFTDIDACPTKSFIVENHDAQEYYKYFAWAVAKRPAFELFNVKEDPHCLENLFSNPDQRFVRDEMMDLLKNELERTHDPRIEGPDKELFDSYPRYSKMRYFPKPE